MEGSEGNSANSRKKQTTTRDARQQLMERKSNTREENSSPLFRFIYCLQLWIVR